MILALCTAVSLSAQVITDGSHWFDGSAYYTAAELEGSILFSGASADGTYDENDETYFPCYDCTYG